MKIFNWVHRRFNNKDAKKADDDKVILLESNAFASACDGWKEGILAIGTLGNDLFQDYKVENDTFVNTQLLFLGDHKDEEDAYEDEMECPLVLKACKHGFDHVQEQDPSPLDEVAKPKNDQKDIGALELKKIRKSGDRTTLADLLRIDSENNLVMNNNKLSEDHKFKVPYHDNKTGRESIKSFLISRKKFAKDDSAQVIKETKRLMRKMLKKKKIHPDMGYIQKKGNASIHSQEMDMHATC
uniref:Protein TILLER ANGLE CONTROL 1 n=1 Tax=Chrysanthemum morifolium TaxID=41568 RepID=A0A6G6XDZ0_CHRMO|nr:Tiller Angle Control 2 [Chrysanthemum x morifolium]